MIFIILTLIFSFQISAAEIAVEDAASTCDCEDIQQFGNDIHLILTQLVNIGMPQEFQANVDGLKLLMEIGHDVNTKQKCRTHTEHYLNDEFTHKLGMLGDTELNLGIEAGEMQFTAISPELIHLVKEGNRVLFLRGELNGQEVYYKLILTTDGKSHLSYLPLTEKKESSPFKLVTSASVKEPTAADMAANPDAIPEVQVVKAKLIDRETNKEVGTFHSGQEHVAASTTVYSEDGAQSVTLSGKVKDINNPEGTSQEAGVSFSHQGEYAKYKATGTMTEEGAVVKQHGSINVGDEQTRLSVYGNTIGTAVEKTGAKITEKINEDVTISLGQSFHHVRERAETEIGFTADQLSGQMKLGISDRGETLELSSKYQVSDSTAVTSQYKDQFTYQQIGLGAEYQHQAESGQFKAGCMAVVQMNEDGTTTATPKVRYSSKLGEGDAHVISCEAGPSFTDGEFEGITFKTQYDYNIPDTTGSVGVYVAGKAHSNPPHPRDSSIQVGVAASVKWGGPREHVSMLKVYQLHHTEVVTHADRTFRLSYYLTHKYFCDENKQRLTFKDETARTFWKKEPKLDQMYKMASDPTSSPPQYIYQPTDLRPNDFCPYQLEP